MSVSWNFFISKRIRKGDVDSWLSKVGIYNIDSLNERLKKIRVRPPSEKEALLINWPVDPEAKNKLELSKAREGIIAEPAQLKETSLGQESLSAAIETSKIKKSTPRRRSSGKSEPAVKKPNTRKTTRKRTRKNKDE